MKSDTEHELIDKAKEALSRAYAPYSNFMVGAALRCGDGRIFTGSNVENSSYSLSVCAERVAVFKAVSEGCDQIEEIAIYADTRKPITPCGACRQVLYELNPNMMVVIASNEGQITRLSLKDLYPHPFIIETK